MTTTQIETKVLIPLDGPDQTLSETRIGVRWVRGVCRVGSGPVRLVPGFSTSGTRPKSGDMKWFFGGRKLDSTIINISLILSKSFYFPRLKCYIVQFLAYTHTLLLTWADAVEKIIINVHGFSVLQQKMLIMGTSPSWQKNWGRGKKSWKKPGCSVIWRLPGAADVTVTVTHNNVSSSASAEGVMATSRDTVAITSRTDQLYCTESNRTRLRLFLKKLPSSCTRAIFLRSHRGLRRSVGLYVTISFVCRRTLCAKNYAISCLPR